MVASVDVLSNALQALFLRYPGDLDEATNMVASFDVLSNASQAVFLGYPGHRNEATNMLASWFLFPLPKFSFSGYGNHFGWK